MIYRIVWESLARGRRRKLLSVLAVSLGIAVTAAVATLGLDVGDKVSRELRSFGANISVTPAADGLPVAVGGIDYRPAGAGAFLPESTLVSLKKIFWRNNIVAFAPLLYAPAILGNQHVVLIGSWFDKTMAVDKSEVFVTGLEKLHPAWKVTGKWPADDSSGVVVGRRLAGRLNLQPGNEIVLSREPNSSGYEMPAASLRSEVAGILETGGPEDNQIIAPLALVQRWAGLAGKVRRIEISALTKPEDAFAQSDVSRLKGAEFDRWYCTPYVSAITYQIQQAIPEAQAKPVYHVAETEGHIVNRVSVLMGLLVVAALVAAGLAVASMMLATVLERRAEIGLFKALGATDARVAAVFLLEACAIGILGGLAGYLFGSLLAWRLALAVFGSAIGIHWVILPICVAAALVVTIAGSIVPVGQALKFSPALALKD